MNVDKILYCKFSDSISLRLFILYENGNFQSLEFKKEYQNSLANNNLADDNGSVAVISGNRVRLTPLGLMNIPPPMSLANLELTGRAPYVLTWWKNYLFVLSMDNISVILSRERSYTTVKVFENIVKINTAFVKSLIFTAPKNGNTGYLVANRIIPDNDKEDVLTIFTFDIKDGFEHINFVSSQDTEVERCAGGLFNSVDSDGLYDENNYIASEDKQDHKEQETQDLFYGIKKHEDVDNHSFYMIASKNHEKLINRVILRNDQGKIQLHISDLGVSNRFDIIRTKSVITENKQEKIVYLTKNNRLYLNNTLLALDATSFEFFKNFLIFTQTSNTPYNILHILDLKSANKILSNHTNINEPVFTTNFNYKTFTMRTLERSALIVTVSKISLVLQMGRGNLETIYPRLLVLHEISRHVLERKYDKAFELSRKNKINLNFIYDVDPEGFFSNVSTFVSQVTKVI